MSRSTKRRWPIVLGGLALVVVSGGAGLLLTGALDGETVPAAGATSASSSPGGAVPDAAAGQPTATSASSVGEVAATSSSPSPSPVPSLPVAATSASASSTAGALHSVVVSSTFSGWDASAGEIVAGGFVGDVVETGGTCTLTVTRAGVTASGSSEALPDASTTSCGEMRAGGRDLVPGTWDAVVSYTSARSTGASAVFSVVIP